MSHIPPRLPKRAGGVSPVSAFPTPHRTPRRPAPVRRDWIGGALLLGGILLSGAIFAATICALVWAFALIEAVLS